VKRGIAIALLVKMDIAYRAMLVAQGDCLPGFATISGIAHAAFGAGPALALIFKGDAVDVLLSAGGGLAPALAAVLGLENPAEFPDNEANLFGEKADIPQIVGHAAGEVFPVLSGIRCPEDVAVAAGDEAEAAVKEKVIIHQRISSIEGRKLVPYACDFGLGKDAAAVGAAIEDQVDILRRSGGSDVKGIGNHGIGGQIVRPIGH